MRPLVPLPGRGLREQRAERWPVKRSTRRLFLQGLAATSISCLARGARAADVSVPVTLQCQLIGKIAAFDRAFHARSGPKARLIVVHKDGESARVGHHMAQALQDLPDISGLPKTVETLQWSGSSALVAAVRARPTALVYLSVGLEVDAVAIAAALAGTDLLTFGATGAHAERGTCVGFELEEGKPKIYVNLRVAKAQNVDFRAALLRLVKLV